LEVFEIFEDQPLPKRVAQTRAAIAWLFARPELDGRLDYLFVYEAGQVSLANIVAMGVSAGNIVLVGDQMELAQPIQGVHPGESGLSVLEYLLQGAESLPGTACVLARKTSGGASSLTTESSVITVIT
jgi:uncharacterized protein